MKLVGVGGVRSGGATGAGGGVGVAALGAASSVLLFCGGLAWGAAKRPEASRRGAGGGEAGVGGAGSFATGLRSVNGTVSGGALAASLSKGLMVGADWKGALGLDEVSSTESGPMMVDWGITAPGEASALAVLSVFGGIGTGVRGGITTGPGGVFDGR